MCFYTSGPVPSTLDVAFNNMTAQYTTFASPQCNPLCPGFDIANGTDCPAGIKGPSHMMSVVFIILW